MTDIDRSALLPYSAQQLFALVADIERYPEFLNGCVGATILQTTQEKVTASLQLSRAGIRQAFTTCNTLYPHERIELELVDGPFERFAGRWQFLSLAPDACKVSLSLHFRLRSGLIHAAAGKLIDAVTLDLVDAVVQRSRTLYGGHSQ